jgi:hypothetical protein
VFVGFTPGKSNAVTIGVLYPRVLAAAKTTRLLGSEERPVLDEFEVTGVPEQIVVHRSKDISPSGETPRSGRRLERDQRAEVLAAEDLVQQAPNKVDVLVADLDEDRLAR